MQKDPFTLLTYCGFMGNVVQLILWTAQLTSNKHIHAAVKNVQNFLTDDVVPQLEQEQDWQDEQSEDIAQDGKIIIELIVPKSESGNKCKSSVCHCLHVGVL